jgi:hypothetical protein
MIRLIIKGSDKDAHDAATLRDIPLRHTVRCSPSNETVAWVEDDYRKEVTRWLCEDSGEPPFPAGTLLHHT